MGSVVDAWVNPASTAGWKLLPEVTRLMKVSKSPMLAKTTGDFKISPEMLIGMMNNAGIDKIMMCAWCRPGKWVFTNEHVLEYTRKYPDRIFGVACVDLADPVAAVELLEKAVYEYKFKALRIVPWLWKLPPNNALYYPLYVKCIQLGIPFCTQVGHTGPLMPSEPGRPVPYLEEVALTFPDLTIVGGHIGYPWTNEMTNLAWKFRNVYIDTSAYLPKYYPKELIQFMTTHGQDKVLFGTNFPQLSWDRCVTSVKDDLALPKKIYRKFMTENACKVFDISSQHSNPAKL